MHCKISSNCFLVVALLCVSTPLFGATSRFGSTDGLTDLYYPCSNCTPVFTNLIPSMRQLGIFPNTAAFSASDRDTDVLISNGTCQPTDYLALARIANYLATSPDVPRPFILDLSGVIFEPTPARDCACDRAHNCSNAWMVRSDYQTRLQTFSQVAGANFNASNVWGIVIFSEIANENGAVTDSTTIQYIANQVARWWPGIPVIGGYPTQAVLPDYGMAHFPNKFPYGLTYILTWDYSTGDPTVGAYPTMYNDPNRGLVIRLRQDVPQKLLYVVGIFNQDTTAGCPAHSVSYINDGARYDFILRKWCNWALKNHTNLTTTLLPFIWGTSSSGGAQQIINWEKSFCGGSSLQPAFVAVANAAATGSSCF